jgi:orotidine-5'-phosphate decarboxylase
LVLDAVSEHCVAAKLQLACFERLGTDGWRALEEVAQRARDHGLLVLADAKRGDIDVTAAAYAQAFFGETATPFGPVAGLGADGLTVNPLLGVDSIRPFLAEARPRGAGLFLLVRTSNQGAADVQGLALADGGVVSDRLAELVSDLGSTGIGEAGLADVGAVVGATAPEWVASLRERMPSAIFLLPGVGAQGGAVDALGPAFAPGPAGGLIAVSRGLVAAHERRGGSPEQAARDEAARLRDLAWRIAG